MTLFSRIRSAVLTEIAAAGENPDNYDVDRIIAPTPVLHGEIVRDYRASVRDGEKVCVTIMHLSHKYGMTENSIRSVLKRSRKG
jgi:hypothetical protein